MTTATNLGGTGPRLWWTSGGASRRAEAARPGLALRSTVMSVASQAVASGTSFLTSVLIGRTCSKEVLGTYALAFSIVIMIRGVQANSSSPHTRSTSRRRGGPWRPTPAARWYTSSV